MLLDLALHAFAAGCYRIGLPNGSARDSLNALGKNTFIHPDYNDPAKKILHIEWED